MIDRLAERARAGGLRLTGEGGLLAQLTKRVVESALEGEINDHLGYGKHDAAGRDGGNSRNGQRAKTVLTEVGPVEIDVPRDRDGTFEPQLVAKRQRRLTGVDDLVISLSAKGLTTGEIWRTWPRCTARGVEADHLHDHRPGDRGHGRVADPAAGPGLSGDLHRRHQREDPRRERREPADLCRARGDLEGTRDILGLWAGEPSATGGPRGGREVLAAGAHRNQKPRRGRRLMVVCDGLNGLPDAIATVWPQTITQTCVVHYADSGLCRCGRGFPCGAGVLVGEVGIIRGLPPP